MKLETPYYLIDEKKLLKNLKVIKKLKSSSGAKSLLALKCFSAWSLFDLTKKYMDGTTSSSLYEAQLGYKRFGKETHAYCVGYKESDIKKISKFADKIIFNSASQLKKFNKYVSNSEVGLRINPGVSYSDFDLADPARKHSRLGVIDETLLIKALPLIDGVMFHFNCENDNFNNLFKNIDLISKKYKFLLNKLKWVSLGGGIYFTKKGYPLVKLSEKLKDFSKQFNIQLYLEPGESVITDSTELVTTVCDIVDNKADIAIVDASIEAHMLDLLVYKENAKLDEKGKHKYTVAGRSCLAGDIFGSYNFKSPLKVGNIIRFKDAGGYTMVKKNWFNGLNMPSIVVKRLNGSIDIVREFSYNDFEKSLS